jgi:hypothetical protein
MNRVSKSTRDKILDIVYELAVDRYPNARGHEGLMQKIALDDFGIGLTKNRLSYWNNGIIKDEKKFMMFALTYGL